MEHPFTCIVSGPTKSGKTTFVKHLIENREKLIDTHIDKIWWCFSENQPLYNGLKNVKFIEGIPDLNKLKSFSPMPQLLILDDLMHESKGNAQILKLFTRGCHHWNISVIHIVQNLFFDAQNSSNKFRLHSFIQKSSRSTAITSFITPSVSK